MKFILPFALGGVALREHTKSRTIGMVHEMRIVVRLLGKSLRRDGLLPDEKLILELSFHELDQLVKEGIPKPALVQK